MPDRLFREDQCRIERIGSEVFAIDGKTTVAVLRDSESDDSGFSGLQSSGRNSRLDQIAMGTGFPHEPVAGLRVP